MALDFGENLADEIVAHLTTDLPAALDAIDAAKADGITLDDIRQYSITDPLQDQNVTLDYPMLSVIVPRVVLPAHGDTYTYGEFAVVLWLIILDPDVEPLRRKRERTMVAIWETIVAGFGDGSINGKLDAAIDGAAARPVIDSTPTLTVGDQFMSDSVMTFAVARKDLTS